MEVMVRSVGFKRAECVYTGSKRIVLQAFK